MAAVADWTTAHRLRSIAYIYARLKANRDVYPTGIPNISAKVKGRKVYDPRVGGQDPADPTTWAWSNNAALCLRDYLLGVPRPDGAGGFATELFGLGATNAEIDDAELIAAANVCDEGVALASDPKTVEVLSSNASVFTENDVLELDDELPFFTGHPVRIASTGTPPAPLVAGTVYYVIPVTQINVRQSDEGLGRFAFYVKTLGAKGLSLATSVANAEAGVAINLTNSGSGTHTVFDADDRLWVEGGLTWQTGDEGCCRLCVLPGPPAAADG